MCIYVDIVFCHKSKGILLFLAIVSEMCASLVA